MSLGERVTTGSFNFVSVVSNVAFYGAFIAGLAGLFPSVATAACVVIALCMYMP